MYALNSKGRDRTTIPKAFGTERWSTTRRGAKDNHVTVYDS
ncbi:MAG: hypothetical protein OEW69_12225 [Nitrospirota bacterium]|nr:hypothetical protein [Nitrospirota bacterium]